jgi:hypothetical protein
MDTLDDSDMDNSRVGGRALTPVITRTLSDAEMSRLHVFTRCGRYDDIKHHRSLEGQWLFVLLNLLNLLNHLLIVLLPQSSTP